MLASRSRVLLFLPLVVVVDGFSVLPTATTTARRLLICQQQVTKDRHDQQSDLFLEELTWAQEGELQLKPDKKDWVAHEFNAGDHHLLAKEHHEWFSEAAAVAPPPRPSQSAAPLADKDTPTNPSPDLHEWFAEEIDWSSTNNKQESPVQAFTGHHEWFSEAVVAPSSATSNLDSIKAISTTATKKDIVNDHQTSLFSFQMANPTSAASPPAVATASKAQDIAIGGTNEWFSSGMKTMQEEGEESQVRRPSQSVDTRSFDFLSSPNEWFSQIQMPPTTRLPALPKISSNSAEWFYQAIAVDNK